MSKIPGGAPIGRALKGAKRAVKASLKEIRDHASKQLSKGNYASAEALVEVARAVDGFQRELDGLITRWKNLCGAPAAKTVYTPIWGVL